MKKLSLSVKILIGLILGIIVGLLLQPYLNFANAWIAPFGTLFLNLIKMIIVPMVFASLVVGAASTGDVKKLGRMGVKTLVYFLITTAIAVIIGLVLGNLLKPGIGLTIPLGTEYTPGEPVPLSEVLLGIIPTNPFKALVEGNMLQIIVFSIFMGIGITLLGEKGQPVLDFFDSLAEITYKITNIIMKYAPIGVFALMVPVVAANGPKVLIPMAKVIIAVYIGCIIHGLVVYSFSVKALANFSPLRFWKGFLPATLVAFTTCSSSATLPVSMKAAQESLDVSKEVSSFVQPLGATINMDGTALYQGVCALFVAQVFGLDLTLGQQITIVLTAVLASIGTAGVPGAGLIMLTLVLQSVGLPMEAIALIAGIDRVLDMARTAINVTGDASAAVVVEYSERKFRPNMPKI